MQKIIAAVSAEIGTKKREKGEENVKALCFGVGRKGEEKNALHCSSQFTCNQTKLREKIRCENRLTKLMCVFMCVSV